MRLVIKGVFLDGRLLELHAAVTNCHNTIFKKLLRDRHWPEAIR